MIKQYIRYNDGKLIANNCKNNDDSTPIYS